MIKTWKNFTRDEFTCRCGCGENQIQDRLVDMCQMLRKEIRAPLIISSGYRCPDHPIEVAKDAPGAHTKGLACDIVCRGKFAKRLLTLTLARSEIKGVGICQKGDKRFIHIDMMRNTPHQPRPWIWTY